MKLKTIASIFNRNKRLIIHTAQNGEQWISNGIAAYSLNGMPQLTPEIVLRIFDVPADKQAKWLCEECDLPSVISFADATDGEVEIEPLKINIERFGINYWLFPNPNKQRIYSFNEDFIKPLLDEPDYLTYYKRETVSGGFVLACKIGMELKAIIAPAMLHEREEFTEEIKRIAHLYCLMAQQKIVNAAYEIYGTPTDSPPETDEETEDENDFKQETIE